MDGFDELAKDRMTLVQASIAEFCQTHRSSKVVVTSRPLEDVAAWSTFHSIDMAPLNQEDVIELIQKADFEPTSTARFKKNLEESGFYNKYRTFLSNPLLCSIMLLVFSQNFEIPNAIHLFYQQAFEALYRRHDSFKAGGFKREFSTSLNEDEFKKVFSIFCLLSYQKEQLDFDRTALTEYVNRASKIANLDLEAEAYIHDLIMCVCVIVPEGLNYRFSHRSFQEYFAAYCVAYVIRTRIKEIIAGFTRRKTDSTTDILSRLNAELFRKEYVLPLAEEYEDIIQIGSKSKNPRSLMENLDLHLFVNPIARKGKDVEVLYQFVSESEAGNFFLTLVGQLSRMSDRRTGPRFVLADDEYSSKLISLLAPGRLDFVIVQFQNGQIVYDIYGHRDTEALNSPAHELRSGTEFDELLMKTSCIKELSLLMEEVDKYVESSRTAEEAASLEIETLFRV